ncbi:DUF1360 domain-containing protein [Jatrophihabitans sp.]|uniref:DUF1360 domain-containing protein n=1 Tax=Jatrophihabitans sp. TaxID=1932789 RepID=UPI002BC37F3C|nr:DUF1360 domain-containing protein [Jatrophihabitans sp.]
MTTASAIKHWARREAQTYRHGEDRPLSGYLAAMSVYASAVAGLTLLGRRLGFRPPERVSPWDVALFGIATHRLTRTVAKDAVTSPVRAPFTTYQRPEGPGEVHEEVRTDSAARHAVGELLTCPFCLGQWVGTGFAAGLVFAPRATRLVAATFASVAVSDFLQFGYSALQSKE